MWVLDGKPYNRREFYFLLIANNQRINFSKCRRNFKREYAEFAAGDDRYYPIYSTPSGKVFAVERDI